MSYVREVVPCQIVVVCGVQVEVLNFVCLSNLSPRGFYFLEG